MIKNKKCKGTGIARGHGCGTDQPVSYYGKRNFTFGLARSCKCFQKWCLNTKQGQEYIKKHQLKASKPRLKAEEGLRKAKEERARKNSLESLKKGVMLVCHKAVRLRDKYKDCVSCGAKWHKDFQAGHYKKAELYSNLKYNEFNINGQCQKCNLRLDGNPDGYKKGIIKRYGVEVLNMLEKMALEYKKDSFKWDREELKETRSKYNKMINELKNQKL